MKKKAIVSVISVICVIAVAVGIFAGCSSKKSNSNTSNSAQKGAITVISREEGSVSYTHLTLPTKLEV